MRPYYHINYETYAPGTKVESFPKELTGEEMCLIKKVRDVWLNTAEAAEQARQSCKEQTRLSIAPGQTVQWLGHEGKGRLQTFWMKVMPPPDISETAKSRLLRELSLRFYWDGYPKPSVNVPLGDFFCNGLFPRKFSSLPVSVLKNGYVCRFPMPFGKSVRAELQNDGKVPVAVDVGYDIRAEGETTGEPAYFHAHWSSASSIRIPIPYPVFRTEGRGHYVGCYLTAIGTDMTWNILEGDESIRIDGEVFPSLHGTGLEDYFNGGWYYFGLFDLPLHGLVSKAPIQTCQYRFHLPDPVGFEKSIGLQFEFGDSSMARGYMSSVAYWYQSSPGSIAARLPPVEQRFPGRDPLEPASIMSRLFELERIGHFDEAMERCLYFAEKFSREAPLASMLHLRATAYRELDEGYEAVRKDYETFSGAAAGTQTGNDAQTLMWFHESRTNALIGAHINGRYRLYLDGVPAGEGDNPFSLQVNRVAILPGEHEITAEVAPQRQGAWFSMYLRTHTTNIVSDVTWEYTRQKPSDWPLARDAGVRWQQVEFGDGMFPQMQWWQFVPNGFVNMQSGRQLVYPWSGWDQPNTTVYLRKKIVIPE